MDTSGSPLEPAIEALLAQHGGPLSVPGQHGDYVMMRADVYEAMLGISENEDAETLAAVRRGLADAEAGRVYDLDDAFDELDRGP